VNTWFVSTLNTMPGEQQFSIIWSMEEFESELSARRYANDALNKGSRVEAGTLPEIRPEICVRWRKAGAWVTSSEAAPWAEAIVRRGSPVIGVRNEIALCEAQEFG
jgi:hypothetical protein